MTRHLILDNSAMVIDRDNHRVFSDPTCSIKDKSKPYKHRPLSCAEFKELQWQHAKTHHFPGFLIVCFSKEDCVWLSDETTMLRVEQFIYNLPNTKRYPNYGNPFK